MHLNNKGYLLAELIVSFVIVVSIAYLLIDLTLEFKRKNDNLYIDTLSSLDRDIIIERITNDVSNLELRDLSINNNIITFTFQDSEKELRIDKEDNNTLLKYGDYVKKLNNYNVGNPTLETKCYNGNSYTTDGCSNDHQEDILSYINIPLTSIRSNNSYDIKIPLVY